MKLRLVDPTVTAHAGRAGGGARAPRFATLDGVTIGLLANGKVNGEEFLDAVAETLATRYRLGEIVRLTKQGPMAASAPIADGDLERMAEHCMAIIAAIGD